MVLQDVLDIELDIIEAFADVGTVDEVKNILWKRQMPSRYDKLYQEDTTKVFKDYTVYGLVLGRMRKDEIDKAGLKYDDAFKVYVVGKSYRDLAIKPKEADRLTWEGITYEVVKIDPIVFGGINILYGIYTIEAPLAAQTEEYREERDPYFEVDASQESDDTNTTGVNNELFELSPASVLGDFTENFDIMEDETDIIDITYEGNTYNIQLVPGYNTAAEVVADLQTKIDTNFGAGLIEIFESNKKVGIKTVGIGETFSFTLNSADMSVYDTLGLTLGLYSGGKTLKLEDTGDYDENGDPINV